MKKLQDKGLGNGTSIIIMVGILARLPQSFLQELGAKQTKGGGGLLIFLIEIAFLIAIIMGLIMLVQGVRKIPINYAKQIVGNRQFGGARQFLPLKVNSVWCNADHLCPGNYVPANLFSFTNFETGKGIARIFQ